MGELTTKLWPIVKREYLERVRSRWFVIATLCAPLVFSALLILPAKLTPRPVRSAPIVEPPSRAAPASTLGSTEAPCVTPTSTTPIRSSYTATTGISSTTSKLLLATCVAFFLYMSIMLFGQSMLSGVIEEKATRVSEIVLSSVRPDTLLAGKVIGISAVGLTQQCIWILMTAAFLSAQSTLSGTSTHSTAMSSLMAAAQDVSSAWLALVVLFFILGFVFFGSLYAAVGATVTSESEARQAAQPVTLMLVMTVVLIQPVIYNPSGTLARTLSILPFSAPILMPLRMAITDVPHTEVAASILSLLLGCVAAVWVAARIYRVALLMYGKRLTLRSIYRMLRSNP